MRKSHIINSKRMSLMGLFLWDMRSHPKNVMIQTLNEILGCNRLKKVIPS
jgi:hypothetical protein